MTRFLDGPAAGVVLSLQQAPLYLRVVRNAQGTWDALDKLEDSPAAGEECYAYRRTSIERYVHVDYVDGGKRRALLLTDATYSYLFIQGSMLDFSSWRAWYHKQAGGE